ncbi:aminotransferase class IV [Flavobacteriaceae bacterium]|jgi:4-amino-4-deoxychorismate lyase|nr:aminotransferase class IV [Flavobacteriaceae bacterium]
MSQFIESIRIHNGVTENLTLHQKRVNKTLRQKAGEGLNLNKLLQELQIPKNGLFKWRLEYTKDKIKQNQLIPYTSKTVKRIKLVEAPDLKYALKYSDRNSFEKLLTQSNADDIIITQKGFITDASYSNLFFWDGQQWVTPSTPLLYGTQREIILKKNLATEKQIHLNNLSNYTHFKRVNAMMKWEDSNMEKIDKINC